MKQTKDMRNLLRNGIWGSTADAFTAPFIIPFALALGATELVIGIINSLQNLGMLASQVPGAEIVWFFRKRKMINVACEILAKTSWLAIVLIPFLPSDSWLTVMIVSITLSSFFVNLSYPAWTSFIADVVPKEFRGRYFGNRNMWMGFAAIIASVAAGFYLDLFPKGNLLGFSSIFLFGVIAGIIAVGYYSRLRGKPVRLAEHSFRDYLKVTGNMRRFLAFTAFFNFSYMIASPFFAVYMLNNLGMDYGSYVLFAAIAAFAGLVSQRHWGRLMDKFGCRPMIGISVVGAAFVPFLYIFINQQNLLMLIPVQILSGVAWAGVGLVTFNMFLDVSDRKKLVTQTANYNIIATLPMVIAPIIGGLVAQNLSFIIPGIPLVFLLSSILRFSSLALLKDLKESHVKRMYSTEHAFRVFVSIHPVKGLVHEIRTVEKRMLGKRL